MTSLNTWSCIGGRVAITVVLHDILYAAAVEPAHKARLPSSLAIKMHPATAEARQLGFQAGLFSKELYFYTTFKDMLGPAVASPRCMGIWADKGRPGLDNIEFFVLMMEDLSTQYDSYAMVDNPPSAAAVEHLALACMVPLHAKFWNKVDLVKLPELDPGSSLLADFAGTVDAYPGLWPRLRADWPALADFKGRPVDAATGFPSEWAAGLGLMDRLAAPGAMASTGV